LSAEGDDATGVIHTADCIRTLVEKKWLDWLRLFPDAI